MSLDDSAHQGTQNIPATPTREWTAETAARFHAAEQEKVTWALWAAQDILRRVLAIHSPERIDSMLGAHWCHTCSRAWPCPTVAAIDGEVPA